MGRKTKYEKKVKLEIVKKYKRLSASLWAKEYDIGEKCGAAIIGEWVRNHFEILYKNMPKWVDIDLNHYEK